ncbi:MAG: hypothetical protein HC932_00235 [Thermales bacterium]|nr:hypothetical protein [Thermales bacterium]
MFLFTFNVSAQNSTTPSSTPTYGIDMTACRFTFDWATYVADQRAGRTASNPYTSQGCVRQNGLNSVSGAKYSDFSVGQVDTKTAFGSDPVLGVFPNGNQPAQSLNTYKDDGTVLDSKESKDRSKVANLNSIFTSSQLSEIYSTGGSRTGMPRIFSTGADSYRTNSNGQRVYQGGWCKVENGQISVRTQRDGSNFDSSLYGRSINDPVSSCARTVNGTKLASVEDRNIQIYQFLYEFKYPTAAQCDDFFKVDEATCMEFFKNRYGGDLAGKAEGSRIISTYTYYGTFNDIYTKWVGWVNPDVNGPRKNANDTFLRGYEGFSVFAL